MWDGTPVLSGPSGTHHDDYGQELIDVLKDNLDTETGRSTDAYSYRLLDLSSELGEVAKDVVNSTDYGEHPEELEISSDEIGDVLFSLLALADAVEIDTGDALDEALAKYEERLSDYGTATSDTTS